MDVIRLPGYQILWTLIADVILELFRNDLENKSGIIKSPTHLSNNMETK